MEEEKQKAKSKQKKERVFAVVSTNELSEEQFKKVLSEEIRRQYKKLYGKGCS